MSIRNLISNANDALDKNASEALDGRYHGKVISDKYIFVDGTEFDEKSWPYCDGLKSAGRSSLTDRISPRVMLEDCNDIGNGFYNSKARIVVKSRPNSRWRPKMAAPTINQMAEKSQVVSPTCSWAPENL